MIPAKNPFGVLYPYVNGQGISGIAVAVQPELERVAPSLSDQCLARPKLNGSQMGRKGQALRIHYLHCGGIEAADLVAPVDVVAGRRLYLGLQFQIANVAPVVEVDRTVSFAGPLCDGNRTWWIRSVTFCPEESSWLGSQVFT